MKQQMTMNRRIGKDFEGRSRDLLYDAKPTFVSGSWGK